MPNNTVKMPTAYDVWELSLIKSMMENPALGDQILDYISADMLQFHPHEFNLVLQQKFDDPQLMAISLNETIKPFTNEAELHKELIFFLRKHYERERQRVMRDTSIDPKKKPFLNRQIMGKIDQLKRGKLVTS
jgi:DNA primase